VIDDAGLPAEAIAIQREGGTRSVQRDSQNGGMFNIPHTLSSVSLGPEITYENLTMLPLLGTSVPASESEHPDYVLLDDALAAGWADVTEVSEHGSVPELLIVNRGHKPLLVVDGEELLGAKQNRVVNLTLMVAANANQTIPVSCVEAGRWRARSKTFRAAPRAQYATGRAKRMSQVTACMIGVGGHHSDQAEVWSDIAQKSARMGATSPTSAMEAMFVDHAAKLDDFVRAMAPVEGQAGAIFVVSGEIVGLELFDRPSTFRKLLPKLVRSVAIDAIDRDRPGRGAFFSAAAAPHFLATLSAAHAHVAPAVGLGEDVRLSAPGITGAALAVDGTVIHLCGFAV
jgi:hypothetical protein